MRPLSPISPTLLALVALTASASAAVQSIPLDFVFSGTQPTNTATPWLNLKLEDGFGPNTVRVTLDAFGLSATEFVSGWYLNLNPSMASSQLSFAIVSNPTQLALSSITTGTNAFQADGDGKYDILFDFPPPPGQFAAKFTSGEQVVIDVSRTGGLSLSDFFYQSVESGGNGVYYTAAHIQGNGSSSAWVGATAIPEPSTYALLIGGVTLGFVAFRKRAKNAF